MILRHKKHLVELFDKVHTLNLNKGETSLLALEIQEELIVRLTRSERTTTKLKKSHTAFKVELAKPGKSREESKIIKAKIQETNDKLEVERYYRWCLRTIGDSIAFTYGNKWDLKNFGFKEDPGFISGKKGARLERKILRGGFARGITVILNDLTNTLRHGDITTFYPLFPEGNAPFFLVEAKSGKGGNKERMDRQMEASQAILSYISTDQKMENGVFHTRIEAGRASTHHRQAAAKLIHSLPDRGFVCKEIEPGLVYLVLDCKIAPDAVGNAMSSALKPDWLPFGISLNDLKQQNLAYYPWPLTFIDSEQLFRFYNGEFLMMIFVDLHTVNDIISKKGMSIAFTDNVSYPWQVHQTTRTSDFEGSFVGVHILGRLASEFLSLEWLLENIVITQDEMAKTIASGSITGNDLS